MRSYVLGDEAALLMASYPHGRPANPFPYFTEVMTGFEHTAAIGMFYEGQIEEGLHCIGNIRDRYDGRKRSPFDEAECGHHYARAMAAWAGVLALSGFQYSGVERGWSLRLRKGVFWSTGYAWGTCEIRRQGGGVYRQAGRLGREPGAASPNPRRSGRARLGGSPEPRRRGGSRGESLGQVGCRVRVSARRPPAPLR